MPFQAAYAAVYKSYRDYLQNLNFQAAYAAVYALHKKE